MPRLIRAVVWGLVFACAGGCSNGVTDPRIVEVISARNFSDEKIRVVQTTGFTPNRHNLGGVLPSSDPKRDSLGAIMNLPRIHVADSVGIDWVYGSKAEGADRHHQDVPVPDEIFAKHQDREDVLTFTFGPDKKWTVKLVPRAER